MKWFKHDCDMHTDLKIQALMEKYKADGYLVWCLCLELVGKEGQRGILNSKSGWQNGLLKVASWLDKGSLEDILKYMVELELINSKSFNYGNLYIPKFVKRADDYTRRQIRTNYGQTTDNVLVEENRIDKNRIEEIIREYIRVKNYPTILSNGEKDKGLINSIYKRNCKVAKELAVISNGDIPKVLKVMAWFGGICDKKGLSWSLETILKWYPEYLVRGEKEDKYAELFK